MKKITCFALVAYLAGLLCFAAPIYGQKFWERKPYQKWSLDEALEILTDSPWAQTLDILKEADKFSTRPGSDPGNYPSLVASSIRLRSALPLRQAFVRHRQISIKYDKLPSADKEKFDAEAKEFLACAPCAKYYVVSMDSGFLTSLGKVDATGFSPAALQQRAYLANDKGQWRPCVHARQDNREILFFFQRQDDQGKPLIAADDKEFYFTTSGAVSEGKLGAKSFYAFEVAKVKLGGEIAF